LVVKVVKDMLNLVREKTKVYKRSKVC